MWFQDYKTLIKEAKIETFSFGQHFSQEHRSIVENKLYVLISGMMTVRCDGIFLQALQPLEFINSIEWKCGQYGQPFSTYQVKYSDLKRSHFQFLDFLAVDNFDFTRKIAKKKFV